MIASTTASSMSVNPFVLTVLVSSGIGWSFRGPSWALRALAITAPMNNGCYFNGLWRSTWSISTRNVGRIEAVLRVWLTPDLLEAGKRSAWKIPRTLSACELGNIGLPRVSHKTLHPGLISCQPSGLARRRRDWKLAGG